MFFVLHGYADATPNEDTEFLEDLFPDEEIIGLNYPFHPVDAETYLRATIQTHLDDRLSDTPIIFTGISLGGFWSWQCANWFDGAAILINPSLRPWKTLKELAGTFKIKRSQERFTFTYQDAEAYEAYKDLNPDLPILALLDAGDKRLNNFETRERLEPFATVRMFEGGSHAFEHREEAREDVLHFYEQLKRDRAHAQAAMPSMSLTLRR